MDRRRAAGALLALAACIACSTAAPTASNQTALELLEGQPEGCYYNFQHYGEGDRIMTNEPCLNCTCHNRMLMCYLKVCPFTKPIGQDCTIEKRADQCCPIVTCPDVPVDLLTSTSTSSPAEYGATGLGKVDKYGCSINGKYFSEGSKVPPTPNKPCEHCYCIRNMTTCVMQECTLHVDGCTPIYHKDVCCPVRYSCDHQEDEMLLLDDMTTTVRPTPGFLLTTTTMPSVTQISQNCVHDDEIVADGALIRTEIACEHCYCMKGDIVCVVQECGTPMENEGKNCTSLPPRQGQCCPDTYICEGDELLTDLTTSLTYDELTTLSPPRRVEGSGYRNEPDEPYTEMPTFEGSGEEQATTLDSTELFTTQKQSPQIIDEIFPATEETFKPSLTTTEPDKGENTVPDEPVKSTSESQLSEKTTLAQEITTTAQPSVVETIKETDNIESKTTISDYHSPSDAVSFISKDDEFITTTESTSHYTETEGNKINEVKSEHDTESTEQFNVVEEVTTQKIYSDQSSSEASAVYGEQPKTTIAQSIDITNADEMSKPNETTTEVSKGDSEDKLQDKDKQDLPLIEDNEEIGSISATTATKIETSETTSVNPVENEIDEDILPPGRIPGEGDCLLNGVTYKNNTNVPNINNCHSSCKCISSIVKCDPIICSPPPEHMDNMNDCQPIYDTPDACCPTYVCHSRETIPPESHSQMSGTESPKPSHDKPEAECDNELCQPHETKPGSVEQCSSGNCKPEVEDQEKGTSPPLTHPDACIGDSCQSSVESCVDGNCPQSATSETTCDIKNGCQPSEACEGSICITGAEQTIPKDEIPICKDSEECKISDSQGANENALPSDCTEESCNKKEQPQEESKSPSQCSGPSCFIQGVEGELSAVTTESAVKDQLYKESTTEFIDISQSKLPESEETSTSEEQKVPHFEVTTENVDISPERSTDKYDESVTQDLSVTITEKGEYYTRPSQPDATKIEELITETSQKPETEYTTKLKEEVTEFSELITKETSTESRLPTAYEEYPTDVLKEDLNGTPEKVTGSPPTKSFVSSTETSDIKVSSTEKYQNEMTDINVLATTSKPFETDTTEQEYTKKEEIITESPEYSTHSIEAIPHVTETQEPSKIDSEDSFSTESRPDISITESSEISPELSTEKHFDNNITENDVANTEVDKEVTKILGQFATEQPIQVEESSVAHETKLDETTTSNIYSKSDIDIISTESPNVNTEIVPVQAVVHDQHNIEAEPESPQTTVSTDIDVSKETTQLSVNAQEDHSQLPESYTTVADKQDIFTSPSEAQEHETSDSSIIHATQPSITEGNLDEQTPEIPTAQKGETTLPESAVKESSMSTISQEFDVKQSTQQPEISITNIQEVTTENIHIQTISSEIDSEVLEDHTDNSVKEGSTITPGETLQEDTPHKETPIVEPLDGFTTNDATGDEQVTSKPIDHTPIVDSDATISSIQSDKDQDISTKYTETKPDTELSGETTTIPEVHSTKLDESNALPHETDKEVIETSTSSQIEDEILTTEAFKQPQEDKYEMPDYMQANIQTQEPFIDENTVAPIVSYTEGHTISEDEHIPVSIDESKTKEKPLYTAPDTFTQFTEKQDTMLTDHVTESIIKDITNTDSNLDKYAPTEHSILDELEAQNIVTHISEMATETADTETKSDTESQASQDISTPQEREHTESPMSLITEASKTHSEEETTQGTHANVPDEDEDKMAIPEHYDTKPQISHTESSESEIKLDSGTPSSTFPEKETEPESVFASESPDYATDKDVDIRDKEKIPLVTENAHVNDISTEVTEKLSPSTEFQDVTTFTQNPIKTDSELYPTDVINESSSIASVITSSEQSPVREDETLSTRYPDISDSVTTITYDHELDAKPETTAAKEPGLEKDTEETHISVDITTPGYETTEDLKDEHEESIHKHDQIVTSQEENHTITPEIYTTRYPVTPEKSEDKQTDEHESSEQEEHITPEPHIATELYYTEQPTSPNIEIQSPVGEDEEKSTEVLYTSKGKDVTTSVYEDLITHKEDLLPDVPESHVSTTNTLTTESSESSLDEENNRRTLSPILEPDRYEQHTTEKQGIIELSDITKPQDTQQITTTAPEKDRVTSIDEEFDHVTTMPQATEGDIVQQTEIVSISEDQKLTVVTEGIDEHTVATQDVTLKPDTELGISEDFYTEVPVSVTQKDEVIDQATIHDDLTTKIKVEISSEPTVAQEIETETSIPKETELHEPTETVASVPSKTGTEISVPIETEFTLPKTTESSIQKETELVVAKVTEPLLTKDTDITEPSKSEVTESTVPDILGTSMLEVTETAVPLITESSEPKVTETSVPEMTVGSLSEETKASVSEVTEAYPSDVSQTPAAGVIDISASEGTEASVIKVSDTSISKDTESETIDTEPEGITDVPKDEKLDTPVEHLSTLEPVLSSSETTPYLVELQEHTTKSDEESYSVTLTDENRTKAPETYQTERGDQPLDILPDKSTQEDSPEEHTMKETFTKKDEHLTTLPPDHASEYPSEILDKTEIATEEAPISSESHLSTLSDAHIVLHTTSSGEQIITMSPTESETFSEQEKLTTPASEIEITTDKKQLPIDSEKPSEHNIAHEATTSEIPVVTKATSINVPEEMTTHLPVDDEKFSKPEDKPSESYSPTTAPELPKPGFNEIQPTEEIPSPDFAPSGSTGYGQEPDYVEEDQAFGPGTCRYGGKVYVSAQQIPRDDPCDFCFCFRSDIICLQQSCPPPIHGCHEEPIQGFCCPRYECPVSMATTLNVTTTTTTTTTTLPPHFLPHAYKGAAQRRGCQIKGHSYKVGEVVRASSGPCLHCTCGGDGQMKCDPKACTPEPMLRQMIAAAVSAKRRR